MIWISIILGGILGFIIFYQAKKIKYLKEGINELLWYIDEEEI